ncbi:hypothetical protein [Arthrobacter sp. FW306-04-A]|uniref:hypothetical protein n=1 Tax=Arthrobacter sp. FW306-04-A TaxID=2879619 RepID=UPI0037C0767C|nr:hypothetical protein LFT43_15710 [Arthrobacter sp. FW306-04-A]
MIITWDPAFITAFGTLLTGLLIFGLSEWVRANNARKERRRQSVVRMLDAIDRTLRAERWPLITKVWRTMDLDLVLAQNRLVMDVPKQEIALWIWLKTRVEEMITGKSSRSRAEIAGEMSGAVTAWYRGDRNAAWFAEQNTKEGNLM